MLWIQILKKIKTFDSALMGYYVTQQSTQVINRITLSTHTHQNVENTLQNLWPTSITRMADFTCFKLIGISYTTQSWI